MVAPDSYPSTLEIEAPGSKLANKSKSQRCFAFGGMIHKDESYEVDPPDWQWQGSDTDPAFSLAKAAHVCILSRTLRSLRLHFLS